jgi:hypothetical protein
MPPQKQPESIGRSAILTIPELEQSKAAVLNSLASQKQVSDGFLIQAAADHF